MTADEDYAAAWLRELWRPVPEYHPAIEPQTISPEALGTTRRKRCPTCGRLISPSYMRRHVRRAHQGKEVA